MPCEIEHVACGPGIQRIYRFLCEKRGATPKPGYVRSIFCPSYVLCPLFSSCTSFGNALHYQRHMVICSAHRMGVHVHYISSHLEGEPVDTCAASQGHHNGGHVWRR